MSVPGHGLVIGSFDPDAYPDQSVDNIIQNRQPILIEPCFGFTSQLVPVQTPEGPAMQAIRQCAPLANCMGPAKLLTVIDSAILFGDMEEIDQKRHKGLVEQVVEQLLHARTRSLGITPAKAGDIPKGGAPGGTIHRP